MKRFIVPFVAASIAAALATAASEPALAPLLYGETLIGDNIPNLTYILTAPDMESHKQHWQAFGKHPEWNRMKAMEKYKGTISGIENYFLVPTDFSQI